MKYDIAYDRNFGEKFEKEFIKLCKSIGYYVIACNLEKKGLSSAKIFIKELNKHLIAPDVILFESKNVSDEDEFLEDKEKYLNSPDLSLIKKYHPEFYEIKAKYPTKLEDAKEIKNIYYRLGIERYRLDHYLDLSEYSPVYYAVKIIAKEDFGNRVIRKVCPQIDEEWIMGEFSKLKGGIETDEYPSYVDNKLKYRVKQIFWNLYPFGIHESKTWHSNFRMVYWEESKRQEKIATIPFQDKTYQVTPTGEYKWFFPVPFKYNDDPTDAEREHMRDSADRMIAESEGKVPPPSQAVRDMFREKK